MALMGDTTHQGRKWDMPKVLLADIISKDLVMGQGMGDMGDHRGSMLMIGGEAGQMGLWVRYLLVWLVVVVWMLVCCFRCSLL
jgi:hypothetical protein